MGLLKFDKVTELEEKEMPKRPSMALGIKHFRVCCRRRLMAPLRKGILVIDGDRTSGTRYRGIGGSWFFGIFWLRPCAEQSLNVEARKGDPRKKLDFEIKIIEK